MSIAEKFVKKKVKKKQYRDLRLPRRFHCARLRSVATRKSKTGSAKVSSDATAHAARKPMSLKKLAEHLDLSPATVSLVINRSSVADSIPQDTKDRIFAAARKFKYRPIFVARSLRTQLMFTIVVTVPDVSHRYSA